MKDYFSSKGWLTRYSQAEDSTGLWQRFVAEVERSEMDNFNTPDLDQGADSILRPGETLEDDFDVNFRKANAKGGIQQLVGNTDDGSRPGYSGDKGIKKALEEITETQKTFDSKSQLINLLEDKLGFKPDPKGISPNRYDILKKIKYESVLPVTTEKQLIETFGEEYLAEERAKGVSDKKLKDRRFHKISFANITDEERTKKVEDTRQRNKNLTEEQILDRKEKAMVRRQSTKGYSFYKVNNAENLLWNDLLRTAKNKNGYFTFKGEAPVKEKYYNKAETEKFVLVDKKGNEFKYSTLSEDITKHSGEKLEDVLRPYKQKEFLAKEGLTKELNKLAGYKPGATKSVFHTQHIQGIDKNPFKVHLTFGEQNLSEAASKKSFDADWKAANKKPLGEGARFKAQKEAVNRYYKSLGPDIVAQIGKQPKGESKTLINLLDKTGIKLTDSQTTGAKSLDEIMETIGKTDPKLAKKVSIQLNSGLPVDQILKEIRKIPGIDKLGRGFMKAGGPFEVAFLGLDTMNEFSKGKTGKQSLKTALSNVTFGAYEGGKREDMNVLLNTAKDLNLDTEGFSELKEMLDLKSKIAKRKKSFIDNAYFQEDNFFRNVEGGEGTSNLKAQQESLKILEKEFETKGAELQDRLDIDNLVNNYTMAVDTVAGNEFEKSKERGLLNQVKPEMGDLGSAITSTFTDYKSLLPQNFLQNSLTKAIPNTLRKIPLVGNIFEPTSERAKLFDMSKEDKEKRIETFKPAILEQSKNTYYPKAQGGIMSLNGKK